jgi:transcription elongation factor GreA
LATLLSPCGGSVVIFLFPNQSKKFLTVAENLRRSTMSDVNYVTQETFNKMQEEVQHLRTVDRPAASRAIAEAREKGDLKENAEYDAAKEAQGMLEAKIKHLESVIANSRIVDTNNIDTSRVSILTRVKITNVSTKKTFEYTIVGEKEADLKAGKISASSPIGSGLLGKKIGEIAEIKAPNGVMQFQIEAISI